MAADLIMNLVKTSSTLGKLWTKELCEADSDSDGQTIGQELGDPCCEWNDETVSTPRCLKELLILAMPKASQTKQCGKC
ncbi:hypothetical protein PPTG_19509 [Phytophthora nicotianae INRA-310]|uniref:Temptin Cys/Cys disulfide domain-containing protein n=2 Tax=Phytophthora nicotianae TaxID=4792 RepID=W2PEH1_PHYN3|nr:hypothetical protein PPTG_19509 [Phytophthora nicotianae INRA-310]ETM98389.1 hypothetical protein PPTG_19509 [Phytophthora nicotianae INRA-310]ETO63879.1 hypothetical protein F444_18492 [Phytophthora nicotianae P1976]